MARLLYSQNPRTDSARDPSNWRLRRHVVTSNNAIGHTPGSMGDTENALRYLYKGLEIDSQLAATEPNSAYFWRVLSAHYDHVYVILKKVDPVKVLEYRQRGIALDERVLAADPKDASNRSNLALGYMKLGKDYLEIKNSSQALTHFGKSLALYEGLAMCNAPAPGATKR